MGNISTLLSSIPVVMKEPNLTAVGVLADANASITSRWEDIVREFRKVDVELPAQPVRDGAITSGYLRAGVWLMPDNTNNGELEDFLKVMIPGNDPVWPHVQTFIGNIPPTLKPRNRSKAEIHAWLTGQPDLLPMGAAVGRTQGYFNPAVPLARSLTSWLDALFK